jgi:hypothetical protein
MIGVTKSMKDIVILEVGTVVIVDNSSCALGQDADGIQRLQTPLLV